MTSRRRWKPFGRSVQAAQDKLHELRQRGDSAWEDMKEGAEKTWDEMRKAIDNILARLK